MYEKSSQLSATYRESGNEYFKHGNYFEALVFYNKALSFATSKVELSLAYANRSAVYLEVKKYVECMQNIEWARENNYPKKKLQKLKEREEKCKKQTEADENKTHDSIFKLSYPANPKIPFIVENIYMKVTPEFGRGIYAATDLKPGDVIAIEEPAFAVLEEKGDACYKRCCYCMKSSAMNLIPCLQAADVMFCSEKCRGAVYHGIFHVNSPPEMFIPERRELISRDIWMSYFCRIFDEFEEFLAFANGFDAKNFTKSIFDFDFSGDPNDKSYKMNLLHCFLALWYQNKATLNIRGGIFADAKKLFIHFANIINSNKSRIVNRGVATLLFGSLINHSCNPNINYANVDNKFAFIVQKPIRANEQLLRDYGGYSFVSNYQDAGKRRIALLKFGFICQCDVCNNNGKYLAKIEKSLPFFSEPESILNRQDPKSYEETVKELKENWKFIEDHADDDIYTCMNNNLCVRNDSLMLNLCKFETFPITFPPKVSKEPF